MPWGVELTCAAVRAPCRRLPSLVDMVTAGRPGANRLSQWYLLVEKVLVGAGSVVALA
ncbi:hypothetical protein [Streptomyces sp. B21-101]|uniref:hypothetical protein n=1 Tax=Streptomyces sp. B21-101 TaxID=3039415 RepID=UPI002FEF23DA